jgi:STAM-binding protein
MPHNVNNMEKTLNVEQITALANEPFFDAHSAHYPIKSWFRTAQMMVKQASIYEAEGNLQMSYFLLYRHASLILEHLPKHPQAKDKDPQVKVLWLEARRALARDVTKLELLKPAINERYETYLKRVQAQAKESPDRTYNHDITQGFDELPERPRKPSDQVLDPHEHKDLAVLVANLEVQRRLRQGHDNTQVEADDDNNSRLVDIRRQVDGTSRPSGTRIDDGPVPSSSTIHYPEVPQQHDMPHPQEFKSRFFPPQVPPKQSFQDQKSSLPPPLPSKDVQMSRDRSGNVKQFASTAIMESGFKLRTTFLPASLRHRFVQIAQANTKLNLETCGILAGTLIQNALFITKLVIPEQIATPDTCEMVDELALFEWTDAQPEGIMVMGWIHTHPTQTCFLSSRDLHTHHPYQQTLPESVAMVCSPSKLVDYGVFRLTDPPGMQAIRACRQTSTFHPHEEKRIYTDALGKSGHVIEHSGLDFEVVDLRPKR